jgi:hypothetical protein
MPIDHQRLWMLAHGFTDKQIDFARNPRPDWREAAPQSLQEKMASFESMAAPGRSDQIHLAQGRFALTMAGHERPEDWPVRDMLQPELKPTDVAREGQTNDSAAAWKDIE